MPLHSQAIHALPATIFRCLRTDPPELVSRLATEARHAT